MRIVNCILAMIGVWVGASFVWYRPLLYDPFFASMATFLVCAAGNIVNDLVDIEIDRINHPKRVLVKGSLSSKYALILSIIFNISAVILAYSVNKYVAVAAVAAIILLYLYNYYAKKLPVIGNVIIAVLTGLTFITGGISIDFIKTWELPGPIIPAIFAFLFHLVREIIKDIQDIDGDKKAGISSLPMIINIQRSILVAISVFFIMVIFTYIPVLNGWFGSWYKIITVYIVDLPLLALLIFLWGNPTSQMLNFASISLKIGMGLGIIALLLA